MRLIERTPLRVKLIVAVLALVAVALALISLASVTALRGYLVGRLDDQLERVAPGFAHERPPGPGRRVAGAGLPAPTWCRSATRAARSSRSPATTSSRRA